MSPEPNLQTGTGSGTEPADTPPPPTPTIRRSAAAELNARTLYHLLRLRVDVFVVEQDCAYPELDGRDLEPDAEQWWVEAEGRPVATLRTLVDLDARRIGRLATHADHRGSGYAAALVRAAVEAFGGSRIALDAQSHLAAWYEQFGFVVDGPEFVEDGIGHVPMLRDPQSAAGTN